MTYNIQKIEDMAEIPEEEIDDFIEELREFLKMTKKHGLSKNEIKDTELEYTPGEREYSIVSEDGDEMRLT